MLKMATYPGMTLGGEVRESISLDEDDMSDVEDEVFIRDGKNSYKLAEELNVKRPLMAPRRKLGKPDLTSRLKAKPPCRAFCRPCCYILAALTIIIDKLRNWMLAKARANPKRIRLLPCSNLKVTDIWTSTLPTLTTESPLRVLDLNEDGFNDIIFGFGTGDYSFSDNLCNIFMNVSSPCKGGVIALDGMTGKTVWTYWSNDTIFDLQCSADLNEDLINDCLAIGEQGTIFALNSKIGKPFWVKNTNTMDIFLANFISDQNNDSIADILSSHTSLQAGGAHIVVLSGKTGEELSRFTIPEEKKSFFMPQLLNNSAIFGSGSPNSPGNLSLLPLRSLKIEENITSQTIYQDLYRGVITQAVLVDITGDSILDIVVSMFNSTVVAINGENFSQIWNYTILESESNVMATPGYFNDDNITDFLVIYSKRDFINLNYTETFIIDGKTGKPIYEKSIMNAVPSQMSGLSLSMEANGFDFFIFWTSECSKEGTTSDECRQNNDTTIVKLNALNQYDQPPGFKIYNSINRSELEFKISKSPLQQIRTYLLQQAKMPEGQSESYDNILDDSKNIAIHKFGTNFRHKENRPDYINKYNPPPAQMSYQDWTNEDEPDYTSEESENAFPKNSRDPRSKPETTTKKKNLPEPPYGIYDYQNIRMAKNRLLNDLNNIPLDILRDTYFKNRENQLRKSKFEQRDIVSHLDKMKENEEVKKTLEMEKKKVENGSFTLWDLESEKEAQDRENGYYRGKRTTDYKSRNNKKITSVGAIVNATNTTIDLVFVTYWESKGLPQNALKQDMDQCLEAKLTNDHPITTQEKNLYTSECMEEQQTIKHQFGPLDKLNFGQMTVYKIRLECTCQVQEPGERCAQFLPYAQQKWPMYMGWQGNGEFSGMN